MSISVCYIRGVALSHTINIALGNLHLPLPGVTEQDLCTLSFLQPHPTLFASLLFPTPHFPLSTPGARSHTTLKSR